MTYITKSILRADGSVRAVVTASSEEELEAQLGPEETLSDPPPPQDPLNEP